MFALSSNFEGMPNALLEAMCMGMPVVSVDCPVGGPRMLIDDGVNGMLVPLGGTAALTDRMRHLINHPEKAKMLGASAAKVREQHSTARVTDAWERLIDTVISAAAGSKRG